MEIYNKTINNSDKDFYNPSGKFKGKTIISRNIFKKMTGVKIFKNTKTGFILYKNTELEMEGNYKILDINFKGNRITKSLSESVFTSNFKSISFENLLRLAAEESLTNPRLSRKGNNMKYEEPKMKEHNGMNGLPCNGIGINFNEKLICSKCNLQTPYYGSDVYGIST